MGSPIKLDYYFWREIDRELMYLSRVLDLSVLKVFIISWCRILKATMDTITKTSTPNEDVTDNNLQVSQQVNGERN